MKQKLSIKTPNELSISDYLKLSDIVESKCEQWEKDIRYISICTGISYDTLMKMTPTDIREYSTLLNEKIKKQEGFWAKLRLNRPKKININGTDYKINYNLEKLNMSQYVDFQTYIQEDNSINNLHNILSVVIIPEGCEYNENYEMEKVKTDIFEHLSIALANDICFFFKKQSLISIEAKILYLTMEMRLLKWTTKDKKIKEQIQEVINQMKIFKKQISDCF